MADFESNAVAVEAATSRSTVVNRVFLLDHLLFLKEGPSVY